MKQYELDCYEVTESDGCGMRSDHLCFVSSKSLAEAIVSKSKGWRRFSPYKKVITIFDSEEEIEANSKANLRKAGLAKLTAAEKQALGLA